jgi:hypothetical protein
MGSNLLALLIFFMLASCQSQSNEPLKEPNKNIIALPISNDWVKDKDGCLKLRNEKLAYKLIEENNPTIGASVRLCLNLKGVCKLAYEQKV